jgi:hypothetical protein
MLKHHVAAQKSKHHEPQPAQEGYVSPYGDGVPYEMEADEETLRNNQEAQAENQDEELQQQEQQQELPPQMHEQAQPESRPEESGPESLPWMEGSGAVGQGDAPEDAEFEVCRVMRGMDFNEQYYRAGQSNERASSGQLRPLGRQERESKHLPAQQLPPRRAASAAQDKSSRSNHLSNTKEAGRKKPPKSASATKKQNSASGSATTTNGSSSDHRPSRDLNKFFTSAYMSGGKKNMRRPSSQGVALNVRASESARSPDGFMRGRSVKFMSQKRSKSRDAHPSQDTLPAAGSPNRRAANPHEYTYEGERSRTKNNSHSKQSQAGYYHHGHYDTGIGYSSPAAMREAEPMANIPRVTVSTNAEICFSRCSGTALCAIVITTN